MFTALSVSDNQESDDIGDYSAARLVRTPRTPSMSTEASSPRRSSAHGWQDYQDIIHCADIKDRQADSRKARRAPGSRLKHKWSAVKLASTPKDTPEEREEIAVDKFRALSPASQETLLQSHKQKSSTRSRDAVQREQDHPRAPSVASARLFFSDTFNATVDGIKRHLEWDRASGPSAWSQGFERVAARVNIASKSKSSTKGRHAATPSTVREEVQFMDEADCAPNAEDPAWASGSCFGPDVEETRTHADCSTPAHDTRASDPGGRTLQENDEVRQGMKCKTSSGTESLTASQLPGASDSTVSEESLEQAMRTLGLGGFVSIDMSALQERLNEALASCDNFDSSVAANAFAAIVKHQASTQCWDRRLRWNEACDNLLLSYEVDSTRSDSYGGWNMTPEDLAFTLGTTVADCRQRLEFLMSQKVAPSPCKPDTDGLEGSQQANGWTTELDQLLMDLKMENNTWSVIAERLDMDERECKRHFKLIKPKGWKLKSKKQTKKEKAAAARKQRAQQDADIAEKTLHVENIAGEDEGSDVLTGWGSILPGHTWTPEQDKVLSTMMEEAWYNWFDIAEAVSRSVDDCKDRVKKLRLGQHINQGWEASPVDELDPFGHVRNDHAGDGWGVVDNDSLNTGCGGTDAGPNKGRFFADSSADHITCPASCDFEDSSVGCAPYAPPKVTFTATIESAGKSIQIPIESKHVSGPEKSIITVGMQAVWKWVHDKGLSDKVDLQDALDLAKSMHQKEDFEQIDTKKAMNELGFWVGC